MENFTITCKKCGSTDCSVYCTDVYYSDCGEYAHPYVECNSCHEKEEREVYSPHV